MQHSSCLSLRGWEASVLEEPMKLFKQVNHILPWEQGAHKNRDPTRPLSHKPCCSLFIKDIFLWPCMVQTVLLLRLPVLLSYKLLSGSSDKYVLSYLDKPMRIHPSFTNGLKMWPKEGNAKGANILPFMLTYIVTGLFFFFHVDLSY